MPARPFEEFQDEAMELYREQQFEKAYDLLTREGADYPEQAPAVLYLRSCLAARTGQGDLALQIIQQALDQGIWYSEAVMRQSPSWQPLQGNPEFERLARINIERAAEHQGKPELFVRQPDRSCSSEEPCPLLLALHGNGDNGERALKGWSPVVEQGWLLASIQSSQAGMMGAYVWDDQALALDEVRGQYDEVREQYALDGARVIVAGFSMGGETALRIALTGTIQVMGFILLGPGGPTIDSPHDWLPLLERSRLMGWRLRGYVLMGDQDNNIEPEAIRTLVSLLNEHGIPCELEVVPGVRHEYPDGFAPFVERALAFIAQEQ